MTTTAIRTMNTALTDVITAERRQPGRLLVTAAALVEQGLTASQVRRQYNAGGVTYDFVNRAYDQTA